MSNNSNTTGKKTGGTGASTGGTSPASAPHKRSGVPFGPLATYHDGNRSSTPSDNSTRQPSHSSSGTSDAGSGGKSNAGPGGTSNAGPSGTSNAGHGGTSNAGPSSAATPTGSLTGSASPFRNSPSVRSSAVNSPISSAAARGPPSLPISRDGFKNRLNRPTSTPTPKPTPKSAPTPSRPNTGP
jgi:hypothetical protein